VPKLLSLGHQVTVLDLFWFGDHLPSHHNLVRIRGDIRRNDHLTKAFKGQDAIIHLACVSNDPCFEVNPKLGKSINYSCFKDILFVASSCQVKRFIYASSSSVYGVSELEKVIESSPKRPLTDYSKFKLQCEIELAHFGADFCWTILRPATVCGYSPRQRLDLVVNILTAQAVKNKTVTIHGGDQFRPNIHILDMVDSYIHVLNQDEAKVHAKIYNVGFKNVTLHQIADQVNAVLGGVKKIIEPVKDPRSYRVCSDLIANDLEFHPKRNIFDAIVDLAGALKSGLVDANDSRNYNLKRMKELKII
jgi:nucleoside-diphosphate-sugar epimerase